MKVIVTGATGNVGTSTVQALSESPEIDEIVGLARRAPSLELPKTTWVEANILAADLGEIFAGPGALRAERGGGANELVAGTPISAQRTHLIRYRVTPDTVVRVAERDTSGAMARAPGTTLEHCPLQEYYQQGPARCWQAGASPRR